MAKLTRTKKYADFREQILNDKEENIATDDLSPYKSRLDNIQDILSPNSKEEKPEYQFNNSFSNDPFVDSFNKPQQSENPFNQSFDEFLNAGKQFKEPKIEENPFEKYEQNTNKQQNDSFYDDFMNSVKRNDNTTNNNNDFDSFFGINKNEAVNTNQNDVFDDIKDDSDEIISKKERDTYLTQTISGVNQYNRDNGQQTIDQLLDNSVNEVRHPENTGDINLTNSFDYSNEPNTGIVDTHNSNEFNNSKELDANTVDTFNDNQNNNAYEQKQDNYSNSKAIDNDIDNGFSNPFNSSNELDADVIDTRNANQDEFSNTVSMEITKIMDEVVNLQKEAEAKESETENRVVEENTSVNNTLDEEKSEEVVDIKNISEMEAEPVSNTMSSTIPFVVAADDEEILDEDEEDGSNTILNIILVVLIVVLIAVLGLIVFYILKTKGIF